MKVNITEKDQLDIIADKIISGSDLNTKKDILKKYSESIEEYTEKHIEKDFKEKFSDYVMKLFFINTGIVLIIIVLAFFLDLYQLSNGNIKPSERLVDGKVLISLIAGTVTQTAIAFGVMTQYVFKDFKKNN